MFKRWMTGWLTIWIITSTSPVGAQSQSSAGSDPDTSQAGTLPAPIPLPPVIANRYFPAFPGLTWTYGGNPRELALMIRMLETQDTSQGSVYLWDGFQGQRWVQNRADGKVMEYRNNQWRMLFDLNGEAGATWTVEPFGEGDLLDNAEMAIVSREEKIKVPYNPFGPVIHISVRNPNLADAGVTDLWFASEIGLIKWSEITIAGPQAYELASFINRNEPVIVIDPIPGDPTRAGLFGTVTDEQGNPVAAGVSLTQSPPPVLEAEKNMGPMAISAWTAHGGEFNFRGIEPGTYTLTARADNYQIHAQQLDIVAGLNRIEIVLKQREQSMYTNVHEMVKGAFIAELATDKQQYAFGDSVYVRYRLTNIGATDLTLTFPSGQQYDLHLDGSQGRVWTWSQDKSFIQALSTQTLTAGETYEFETAFVLQDNWDKNTPSFLLSSHLAVSLNSQVTSDMTEAIVKFAISGWVAPTPGRPAPLSASLNIAQEQYASGDTVTVTYQLTNTSRESVTLAFNSGQRYDLVLNGPQGTIWGWSWTRLFTAETGELVLAPGDSFTFEEKIALAEIPNPADGVYVLRVYMTSTDELADTTEAKSRFWLGDIPPPATPGPLPADPTASEGTAGIKRTGDFDANGQVDFTDFLNFASAFGAAVGMADYKTDFDFDNNGQIAFPDFLTFASVFGK